MMAILVRTVVAASIHQIIIIIIIIIAVGIEAAIAVIQRAAAAAAAAHHYNSPHTIDNNAGVRWAHQKYWSWARSIHNIRLHLNDKKKKNINTWIRSVMCAACDHFIYTHSNTEQWTHTNHHQSPPIYYYTFIRIRPRPISRTVSYTRATYKWINNTIHNDSIITFAYQTIKFLQNTTYTFMWISCFFFLYCFYLLTHSSICMIIIIIMIKHTPCASCKNTSMNR